MVRFLVKITSLKENSIANLTSDLKKDALNYQTGIKLNISTIRQIFSSIIGNTMKPEEVIEMKQQAFNDRLV